jgi:hypothetical protein
VYFEIFSLLDRRSVENCLRVCKHWHTAAFEFYYQWITLKGYNIILLKEVLFKDDQEKQLEYFKYGMLIKSLR